MLLNVMDFPTPQAALDAARDGDRVYFPSTRPWKAPAGGFVVRRNIEVFGDGAGAAGTTEGTTFLPQSNLITDHVLALQPASGVELENVFMHDIKITNWTDPNTGLPVRGGNGIHCDTTLGVKKSKLRLARMVVLNLNGDAFHPRPQLR